MKNVLIGLFLVLFFSCKESGVQLGKPSTFVRYYNGGLPDNAQAIIETSDKGFLILANSQKCATCLNTRIKLIKTDAYGNQSWQKLFPDPNLDSTPDSVNYSAYGLAAIPDASGADTGYLLVGEHIYVDPNNNNASASGLLMIQVDKDGNKTKLTTKKYTSIGVQVQGAAVAYSAKSGSFFVLGKALTGSTDMFLAEVDGNTLNLDLKWWRTFGASTTKLANRVFLFGDSIYWGGTRNSSPTEIRWVKSQINTVAESDKPYPSGIATSIPSGLPISFSCNDICRFGFGYGFTGGYSVSAGQYRRTYFFRIDGNGNMTDSASYALKYAQPYPSGNSITSTLDGGFLILATEAADAQASDTNYRLIKIDSRGVVQWSNEYGGRFIDIGSKVLQASDGGYIVLGTTTLANVPSVFLMKTDSQGNIQ